MTGIPAHSPVQIGPCEDLELSPTLGDGSGLSLRSNDLDSVGEFYAEDDFRQLVVTIEASCGRSSKGILPAAQSPLPFL
jgi:hypothetical protein